MIFRITGAGEMRNDAGAFFAYPVSEYTYSRDKGSFTHNKAGRGAVGAIPVDGCFQRDRVQSGMDSAPGIHTGN